MDTILILALPLVGALALFFTSSSRKKARKYQQENGIELWGTVTSWSMERFGKDYFYWIEVEANGTIYKLRTQSMHGLKYKRRKDVRILVDRNEAPASLQDMQMEILENFDRLSETLTDEEREQLNAEKQRLTESFDEMNQHLLVLGSEAPVLLPVLWEDRVKPFNVVFPIVFGVLLLLVEVFAILCLAVEISGVPFPEWFAQKSSAL